MSECVCVREGGREGGRGGGEGEGVSECVCVCVCVFGSRAMQAAGIEPAPSRHEPGDSTTDTAPTTTQYMHTRVPGSSLWPSRLLTGQDGYDRHSTHTNNIDQHGTYRCTCAEPALDLPSPPPCHENKPVVCV